MSLHSVDDFDPTSSTPVFGSGVSQTKIQQQQQPNNDLEVAEKLITPPQPVVNGQNDITNNKNSDSFGNDTTESVNGNTGTNGSADVHVNGQNEKTAVDTLPPINATTKDNVNPAEESISASGAPDPIEKSSQNDPLPAPSKEATGSVAPTAPPSIDALSPTEPEPALSTSADVAKEDLSSAPSTNIDNAPPVPGPPAETTSNDNVPASATAPETTVLAQSSATPERKTKSPRVVKAKSPAVSTPPTRQSTRSRKPVTSSSQNEDETEDIDAPTTSQTKSSPKRAKRQPVLVATEDIQASNEPTSTTGTSLTEEVTDPTDHDVVPSNAEEVDDDDTTGSKTKKKTPSPRKGGRASTSGGRKRGASSSPSVSASKKTKASPKGKPSITLNDEEQPMDVDNTEAKTIESETVQTPPKKARTSANKKTPTSATTTPESGGDYVRKLRPRK